MAAEGFDEDRWKRELDAYAARWPGEAATVRVFRELLGAGDADGDRWRRERRSGHFTGSAFVVSADGERTLLLHHRKLGRWLQPGGHADGERELAAVALREAEEETGLSGLVVDAAIFDLDRHLIPARGAEPEHWHYDVRYPVRATGGEDFVVNEESLGLAWQPVREVATRPAFEASLRRMARKWLAASR